MVLLPKETWEHRYPSTVFMSVCVSPKFITENPVTKLIVLGSRAFREEMGLVLLMNWASLSCLSLLAFLTLYPCEKIASCLLMKMLQ